MICPNCHTELPDNAQFCGMCGNKLTAAQDDATVQVRSAGMGQPVQSAQPAQAQQQFQQAPAGQKASQQEAFVSNQAPTQPAAEQGMKWYKFIIWVQLFLSALASLASAISLLTGIQYSAVGADPELVYAYFSGLKAVDMICGILFAVLAVLAIVVRMQLAQFKKDAPRNYLLFLVGAIVVEIVYMVAASAAFGSSLIEPRDVSSVVTSIILIFVNKVYFDKRMDKFVN